MFKERVENNTNQKLGTYLSVMSTYFNNNNYNGRLNNSRDLLGSAKRGNKRRGTRGNFMKCKLGETLTGHIPSEYNLLIAKAKAIKLLFYVKFK